MNIIWLVLTIVFLVAEAATVGLVSLWFAFGALGALIVEACGGELWLQITVFVVVSAALLLALRPLSKKYLRPKITKTNVDGVVGATGLVTEDVDNLSGKGQVKIGGMYWTARSESGEPIPVGTKIEVCRIEGVKAFVAPVKEKMEIGR